MEHTERILFIHHIAVIALTAVCAIMWIKINILKKRIQGLEKNDKVRLN